MTQGHDYDAHALLGHLGPAAHAIQGGMHPHAAGGHPMLPHGAPSTGMVPAASSHEVAQVHQAIHGLRGELAQMRETHRQGGHHPGGPGAGHHGPHGHERGERRYAEDDVYEARDERRDDHREREHERHERHRHHHNEHDRPRGVQRSRSGYALKIREFPVGFVQPGVPAGQLAEIEVKPQVKFQGHRLAVAQSIARYFNIVDIKVGKDSQLAATGEMPAEAFSALAVGTQMELDCAPPGIVITLIVHNTDAAADHDFGAVLYGQVEED
jgi:hypothetical protein